MNRDWQQDVEMCSFLEGEQWINEGKQLEEYDRLNETGCRYIATFDRKEEAEFTSEAREALPYWLQQAKFWQGQYDSATDDAEETQRQLEAEKERTDKLKEALEAGQVHLMSAETVIEEALASLYPKE